MPTAYAKHSLRLKRRSDREREGGDVFPPPFDPLCGGRGEGRKLCRTVFKFIIVLLGGRGVMGPQEISDTVEILFYGGW